MLQGFVSVLFGILFIKFNTISLKDDSKISKPWYKNNI